MPNTIFGHQHMLSRNEKNKSTIEHLSFAWLERDATASAIGDGSLILLWANRSMISLIHDYRDVLILNGSIAINPADNQVKLVNFVQECGTNSSTLLLPDRATGHFIVQGRLVSRNEGRHFVGLQIRSTADFKPHHADLSIAFGLTKMEHWVLLKMLDGRMADQISSTEGTSIGTVRTHIRHIYEKMHVTSREGLFSAVSPYRL
jgi:DNA-binding CsgD family transcriptional regulator